jgi:hypothetical protein
MLTKYYLTLTVILSLSLCGCYTVSPTSKSSSISGKDCKVSFILTLLIFISTNTKSITLFLVVIKLWRSGVKFKLWKNEELTNVWNDLLNRNYCKKESQEKMQMMREIYSKHSQADSVRDNSIQIFNNFTFTCSLQDIFFSFRFQFLISLRMALFHAHTQFFASLSLSWPSIHICVNYMCACEWIEIL